MLRLYDWLRSTYRRFENPLLMKELRQAVRSRIYVYAFMTILFICFFIMSLFLLVEKGEGATVYGGGVGEMSFLILFVPFYIVALLGIPMTAFLSQLYEVEQDCLELVQVTNLTTGQIIRGKIYGAAVKLLLFLTALIPFFAFSYLLRGISIIAIVVPLAGTLLLSTLLVAVYVFFSMLVQTGFSKVMSMLFVVGLSAFVGISMYSLGYEVLFDSYGTGMHFGPAGSGWGGVIGFITMVLAVWGCLIFLFHQASLAMAMKSTKNHTWPVRFAFLIFMVVLLSFPFIVSGFGSIEVSLVYATLSFFVWPFLAILALVWVTEDDRIPRTVAESNHWYMSVPYLSRLTLPGGVWGYHFTVLCCLFIIGLGSVAYRMDQPFSSSHQLDQTKLAYQTQFVISGYMLLYGGIAHYLGKLLRSFWPHMMLRTIRGIVIVGVLVVMIAPVMVLGFTGSMTRVDVLNVFTMFNPFFMIEQVQENNIWVPYFIGIVGMGTVLWGSTFVTGRRILQESHLQDI